MWPSLPSASTATGNRMRLADRGHLGLEALLQRLLPEGGEVGRQHDAGEDLAAGVLEGGDLRREVVGEVLVAAGIGELVALLRQHRREADLLVAPGIAVAVVGEQAADRLVGGDLAPHVGEDGDDVLEPPEVVIDVVERLPGRRAAARIGLLADEPGLPRRHGGDARHLLDLALRADRVGGLGRRGDQHQVDLVADDQLLGDLGGAVGIGLAVLDDHLDRTRGVADLDAALHGLAELAEHEIVGLGEGGERPGLRADVAELDRPGLGMDGGREHRAGGERRAGGGAYV